jgi:mono/diheme cytochrome c family protein
MKSLLHYRRVAVVMPLCLIVAVFLITSCVPEADAPIISPRLGAVLAQIEADGEVKVEPTPEPLALADLTPVSVTLGLPADFATALETANPENATTLSLVNGCAGCHSIDPAIVLTGPTWHNIGDTATNRVPGESPALYLYTSIVDPAVYEVPNYPSGVMPKDFGQRMSQQEIADIVAYLLTLNGQ